MHRSWRGPFTRIGRRTRLLAATACLLLAVLSVWDSAHRSPATATRAAPATVPVVVAARDLPAGHELSARDLGVARWPRALAPPGAVASPHRRVGARLAGPIRSGEAVTVTRVVGSGLAEGLSPGFAAVPVPVPQTNATALLRPGEWVELLSSPRDDLSGGVTGTGSGAVTVVSRRLLVLAVLPATDAGAADDGAADDGAASLVVAADSATTLAIARAQSVGVFLAVAVSP